MKQREGIKFEPTAGERAKQQQALAAVFRAQAERGIGVFTPGNS